MEDEEESEQEEEESEEEEDESEEEQSEEEELVDLAFSWLWSFFLLVYSFHAKGDHESCFLFSHLFNSMSKKAPVKLPLQSNKGGRLNTRSKPSESSHSTPRSQQSTPKQSQPANKGGSKNSGKKSTPVSNGKPPPRAGSRSSARLSLEVPAANGTTAKSNQSSPAAENTDSRKRPITGKEYQWIHSIIKNLINIKEIGFTASHQSRIL